MNYMFLLTYLRGRYGDWLREFSKISNAVGTKRVNGLLCWMSYNLCYASVEDAALFKKNSINIQITDQ